MPHLASDIWGRRSKTVMEITLEREAADLRERIKLRDLEAEVKALREKLGVSNATK